MEYKVAFDILQSGYREWWFAAIGVGMILLGLSMFYLKRFWDYIPFRGPQFLKPYFPWIFTAFAIIFFLLGSVGSYTEYMHARKEFIRGNAKVIEGVVSNFKPGTNQRGSAYESFCVTDKCFEYSDFGDSTGFNNMTINGGPIQEGLPIRVTYVDGVIVKLEVGTPALSANKSMGAPSIPAGWKLYTYNGYEIAFPSDPQVTHNNPDPSTETVTYAALDPNNAAYFLTVTTFQNTDIYDPKRLLQNAAYASVKLVGGSLEGDVTNSSKITSHDSVDFVIDIPDGPRKYEARDIYKDNKLYELRVVHLSSKSGDFKGLVNSFRFE